MRAARRVDRLERVRVADDLEGLDRGCRGDAVAGVRAAVADLVGKHVHDLATPAERGRRIAVAHRLGERAEVRLDAEELGGPAARQSEPGLDLVEDQQDPEFLGEGAHLPVEALLRHDRLGVAEDRLDDDRRDLLAVPLEDPAKGVDVVVARRDDRVRDGARDAAAPGERDRRIRVAELGHVVRADADQRVVVDAVVLALELHDLLAARVGAGDAHRVHRRLGARHGHAGHVDPARELLDELHRADLVLARQAEAHAPAHALVDVVVDPLVPVAEDHRPVAHAQVDELVAVGVPDHAALAPIDVDRALAPGAEIRIRATGQRLERSLVQRVLGVATERGRGPGGGFRGHQGPLCVGFRSGGVATRPMGRALRDAGRRSGHRATGPSAASTRLSSRSAVGTPRIPRRLRRFRADTHVVSPLTRLRAHATNGLRTPRSTTGCASRARPRIRR